MATKQELLAAWRGAREAFKLDDKELTPVEKAGLLIEQLGSLEAALRLVWVHQNVPMLVELEKPEISYEDGLIDLLAEVWLAEQGDETPTRQHLMSIWQAALPTFNADTCLDANVHAGGVLTKVDDLDDFIGGLGISLYSPFHYVEGFAKHPVAAEVLFLLELVSWQEKRGHGPKAT